MKIKYPMKRLILLLILYAVVYGMNVTGQTAEHAGWADAKQLLDNLKDPVFSDKVYNVIDFGAKGDGRTKNTAAINAAIIKCSSVGGGHVVVSRGDYLTGAIHLKSNVDLHIEANAILRFSTDPGDYLPLVRTRWEGDDCYNFSPLIYADGQTNFAVTG